MPKISAVAKKVCDDEMQYRNRKFRSCPALTILEVVIALAIITIIFAAVLPQFRAIKNGWDSRRASAELLQNGRILIDHISRNLAKAVKINDVSESTETNGFIEFQDNDGNNWRYDINSTTSYVEFGLVGALSDLAGPVNDLQFTCYDACDLDTALDITTADMNDIRYVEVQTTLINSLSSGRDIIFTAAAYLRTNDEATSECDPNLVAWWKLDETSGLNANDSSVNNNDGTLTNMVGNEWTIGQIGGALNFDGNNDYVSLGTDSSLNFVSSEPFTIAAWVSTTDDYGAIVSFRNSTDDGPVIDMTVGYDGVTNDSGKAMILVREDGGGGGYAHVVGESVDDGQWHHVAAVRGSGGTIELFLDGVSQGTDSGAESGGAITTNLRAIGSERRWVSDGYGTADQRYLAGTIDDVRIYSRALDANEIAQLAETLKYVDFTEAKVESDSASITISTPSGGGVGTLGSWTSGLTHTAESGSNRLLILTAHVEDNDSDMSLNSVTYGGQAMTKVIEIETQEGNFRAYVVAYILDETGIAAATSDTFSPSWSSTPDSVGYSSVFLQNVDQSDPIGDSDSAGSNSGTTISTGALLTNDGDMAIVAGTAGNTGDYSVDNGFTEAIELTISSADGIAGYKAADGSNETPSITHNNPQRQVIIGFVVQGTGVVSGIEGDLLIAAVATDGDTSTTLSPPTGEGWVGVVNDYSNQVTLGVWYKLADASESASHEFTWSSLNPQKAYGWIMHFTGHDSENPINAYSTYGQSSSTPTSPAVTTTVNNCLILRLGAFDNDDITEDDTGLTGHTTITMDDSGASGATLFSDDFESGGFGQWTQSSPTSWDITTAQSHSDPCSAHADDGDFYIISDPMDTSSYSEFTIDFWYQLDDTENGDIYLYLYDGSNYDNYADFGSAAEDQWLQYTEVITDTQYLHSNFRIAFVANMNNWRENVWIDDVSITVPGTGMVSGGAGYVKQSSAGSSGTENFALTASNASQMLTVAIAPADQSSEDCSDTIYP